MWNVLTFIVILFFNSNVYIETNRFVVYLCVLYNFTFHYLFDNKYFAKRKVALPSLIGVKLNTIDSKLL